MKKSSICLGNKTPKSNKQKGATMVEYAIMVALIAIVAIAAVALLGTNVSSTFNRAAQSIGTTG